MATSPLWLLAVHVHAIKSGVVAPAGLATALHRLRYMARQILCDAIPTAAPPRDRARIHTKEGQSLKSWPIVTGAPFHLARKSMNKARLKHPCAMDASKRADEKINAALPRENMKATIGPRAK